MIISTLLVLSISASWLTVSFLVKTRASIPLLIPVPSSLLLSKKIWHDYHCSDCQEVHPNKTKVSKALMTKFLSQENKDRLADLVVNFLTANSAFQLVTPPLSFQPTCCDNHDKEKVLYIVAKSSDLFLCFEPRGSEDKVYLSLIRNRHCRSPPYIPVNNKLSISTPSNSKWPHHWHAWIYNPNESWRVEVSKGSNPFWPQTELPWQPKVTHPVVKTAERFFTSVPIWIYSKEQLNLVNDVSNGHDLSQYEIFSNESHCKLEHLSDHKCPSIDDFNCSLEHLDDHKCPEQIDNVNDILESELKCSLCKNNHNLDYPTPCSDQFVCQRKHCSSTESDCSCYLELRNKNIELISQLTQKLSDLESGRGVEPEQQCDKPHCSPTSNNCQCKQAQIDSSNRLIKSMSERFKTQLAAAQAGCTRSHCSFTTHCHMCVVDEDCMDCCTRVPAMAGNCDKEHCDPETHCHVCKIDLECEQCLERLPQKEAGDCDKPHCDKSNNNCECRSELIINFQQTHARVVDRLSNDIEKLKNCEKQHCESGLHCDLCVSAINCDSCISRTEGFSIFKEFFSRFETNELDLLLGFNIETIRAKLFTDNNEIGKCRLIHMEPSLTEDFDIFTSVRDDIIYGDLLCIACGKRHFTPESYGCAAETIPKLLEGRLINRSNNNLDHLVINWGTLLTNSETITFSLNCIGRSNSSATDIYIKDGDVPPLLNLEIGKYRTKRQSRDQYYYRLPPNPTVRLYLIVAVLGEGKFYIGSMTSDRSNTYLSYFNP